MRRNARRGKARASAHQKRSPQLYLQSPGVYFDAHCDHSLPREKVSSETTQRTPWAPSAFESHRRAQSARCIELSSTNGSAAHRCCAEPTGAQPGEEAANGLGMALSREVERVSSSRTVPKSLLLVIEK